MKVAIIDFETTGKDPKTCRPIEVGVAICNNDFSELDESFSTLIWDESYPEISKEIEELTSISKSDLLQNGCAPKKALENVVELLKSYNVQYVIAYNAEFDMTVFNSECQRQGLGDIAMTWLCAMKDVKSNYNYKCWRLSHLALDYGVPIDPDDLHRAMADVFLTIDLLKAAKATASDMYAFNRTPWHILEAVTIPPWKDGGKSTTLAKEKGYAWEAPRGHFNGAKYPKKWVKAVREEELEHELNETLFQVRRVL